MAELKVYLSEELDKKFRMLAMSIFGYGRGSLSEAAVEALSSWCKERESQNIDSHMAQTRKPQSDPAARAEERPSIMPSAREKDTPAIVQTKTNETIQS